MSSKLVAPLLIGLVPGLAACGSSAPASHSSSSGAHHSRPPARIYRIALTDTGERPHGAPGGTGAAVIAIHGSSVVCWRFAHLRGFLKATAAHIHLGVSGKSGRVVVPLSTGRQLRHRGCTRASASVITAIEQHPERYYVNVHSLQYPAGAVRAQL